MHIVLENGAFAQNSAIPNVTTYSYGSTFNDTFTSDETVLTNGEGDEAKR